MLKGRNKRLASILLIAGLSLGVVACSKDDKETSKVDNKVVSTMSKNDVEKNDNKTENESKNDENKEVNKPSSSTSGSTSKPSTNKPSSSTSSSTSKPSTNKPSNSTSGSTSKPSTNKPNSGTSGSTSKPSTNKPNSGTSGSTSKPSTNKPSSSTSGSTSKPVEPSKPVERTWEYMSSLSQETFNALNAFRQANGVEPLKYSSSEQARANNSAKIAVETEKSYHDTLQISLANNIGTSTSFINQWANSPSHKKSMLDEGFTEGAVSVYKDSKGHYYVVASFYLEW